MTPEETAKLSRRHAMTGGYEIALKEDLKSDDLVKIFDIWSSELKNYTKRDSELFSSNVWRILKLIEGSNSSPSSLRAQIQYTLALTGATIFVVDDEPIMREVTQILIEEYGGKTLVASSGEEALSKLKTCTEIIDCFFIDFSMPRMNGYELYQKLLPLVPDLKVVFSSGLKATDEVSDLTRSGKATFIPKPFDDQTLLAAFRALIAIPKPV